MTPVFGEFGPHITIGIPDSVAFELCDAGGEMM
jgi:hypothetical protein